MTAVTEPAAAGPPVGDPWSTVHAVQMGDLSAFADIYQRYAEVILDYAYSKTGNRATAEDVMSETFLRALKSIQSIRNCGKDLGSWLFTIARNIIIDMVKSSWNRYSVVKSDVPERTGHSNAPEHDALAAMDHTLLLRGLGQLTSAQRECLWLRFFLDLSVDEVAVRMRSNRASVRALQHRAVRRLADILPPSMRSFDS